MQCLVNEIDKPHFYLVLTAMKSKANRGEQFWRRQ